MNNIKTMDSIPSSDREENRVGSRPVLGQLLFESKWHWDLVALVIPCVLLSPLAIVELQRMLGSDERVFAPLMLIAVIVFIIRDTNRATGSSDGLPHTGLTHTTGLTPRRQRASIGILGIGVSLGIFSWWVISPWLAYVASAMAVFAWSLTRFSATPWWRVTAWTALLATTIRLPVDLDLALMTRLQGWSASLCDFALDALWVPHLKQASIIELTGKEFFVEDACSGVTSLFALLAFASLSLYWRGASLTACLMALPSVPVWAMAGNYFRLLLITLGYHRFGLDLASGLDHELLGIATFLLSVSGYCLTESVVLLLTLPVSTGSPRFREMQAALNGVMTWPTELTLRPSDATDRHDPPGPESVSDQSALTSGPMAESWSFTGRWGSVAIGILIMLLAGFAAAGIRRFYKTNSGLIIETDLPDLAKLTLDGFPQADALPMSLPGDWVREDFRHIRRPFLDRLGQHSLAWRYRRGDSSFLFSLDFPYKGPHGLEYCYHYAGWTVQAIDLADDLSDQDWPFFELTLQNDLGFAAHVCYSTFSESGEPVRARRGIAARLTKPDEDQPLLPICYQVQLLRESPFPLTKEERLEMAKIFTSLRDTLLHDNRKTRWPLLPNKRAVTDERSPVITPANAPDFTHNMATRFRNPAANDDSKAMRP